MLNSVTNLAVSLLQTFHSVMKNNNEAILTKMCQNGNKAQIWA